MIVLQVTDEENHKKVEDYMNNGNYRKDALRTWIRERIYRGFGPTRQMIDITKQKNEKLTVIKNKNKKIYTQHVNDVTKEKKDISNTQVSGII